MSLSRRKFLGWIGAAGITAAAGRKATAATTHHFEGYPDSMAVLHDITLCIGCRRCEGACNTVNELPAPDKPFTDLAVLDEHRRTTSKTYTVVNQKPINGRSPVFVKNSATTAWSRPAPRHASSRPLRKPKKERWSTTPPSAWAAAIA
jgi:formate dehydrogenase iron-sulfur subunit